MRVVGLDLSLTATGVACYGEFGWDEVTTIKTPAAKIKGHERLDAIVAATTGYAMGADLVMVEGPSFGSQGSALHQMGGLWWIVTNRLHRLDLRVLIAAPAQVKKYATGSGNADKDTVMIEVTKRFPEAKAANNNEADAAVLAAMGRRFLDEPIDTMPKTHLEAMKKIREEAA